MKNTKLKKEFWIITVLLILFIILQFVFSAFGAARSSRWPRVRAEFLKSHPACAVCGSTKKLEVHHILPVHIRPDLELDANNLIALCERDHFLFGHLDSWRRYNPFVSRDANEWNLKLKGK